MEYIKDDKRIIEVINKIDLLDNTRRHHNYLSDQTVFVSAFEWRKVYDKLKIKIAENLRDFNYRKSLIKFDVSSSENPFLTNLL